MSTSRPVWHLPFALLTVSFLLCASVGLWYSEWILGEYYVRPPNALDGILSPKTLDALFEDDQLRSGLLSLTEAVAKVSTDYGETYSSEGLKGLGKNLIAEVTRFRAAQVPKTKKRQVIGDTEIMKNGLARKRQQGKPQGGLLSAMTDLMGGGNSTGSDMTGLGNFIQQGFSQVGGSLVNNLATPAYFLGIGLGMGTETGLNLTDLKSSQSQAMKVAAAIGQEPTGINLVAQNLGSGLTAQIAPSLGNTATSFPVGMAAFALAQGIGQGSASGLNLTQTSYAPVNSSDLMAIARNFGLGIAAPIAKSLDFEKLMSQAGSSSGISMTRFGEIAAAAGEGLGEGVSKGLGLTKTNATGGSTIRRRQALVDPNAVDVPNAVGNFTLGLSQSFLGTANLSKIIESASPGRLGLQMDAVSLVSIASGAGKGLGEGLAIGFNFTAATNRTIISPETGGAGINKTLEQTSEQLVKGLFAGFLQNGGASIVSSSLMTQAGNLKVDTSKTAEGAARGLVEGTVNALSQGGGFRKVLSGDFPKELPMNLLSLAPSTFNDSVNGSVVSFMRGLSGEGLLLFAQYMNTNKSAIGPPQARRNVEGKGVVSYDRLNRRENPTPLAIDSQTLQDILQSGTNALTCSGIGGLAALALALKDSPTLKAKPAGNDTSIPLDNSTLAALPKDPFTIESEGSIFTINIAQASVTVNELPLIPFAVLTGVHVLLTTLAFFFFLPAYIAMGAVWRIAIMIGHPYDETSNKKWRKIILLGMFTPSALVGIPLGIAGMGQASHFRTLHGIMGLIALTVAVPTIILSFMRLCTTAPIPPPAAFNGIKILPSLLKSPHRIHVISAIFVQLLLVLGMFTWTKGFDTLRSMSLCVVDAVLLAPVVVAFISFVVVLQTGALALLGLRQYLEQRIAKSEAKAAKEGGVGPTDYNAKGSINRSNMIKTFGFDIKDVTPPARRSPILTRQTAELLGREDSQIGWPANVRKFGDEDVTPDISTPSPNPFLDSMQPEPRVYNAKLGGYEDERSPAFPPASSPINPYGQYGELRPSSELDPQSRQYEERRTPGSSTYESYSRPFDGRKASGEDVRERYNRVERERRLEEETMPAGYGYSSGQ